MANRKKPEKPQIDDTQEIVDAVIVEEDDAQSDPPDEKQATAETASDDSVESPLDTPEDAGASEVDAQPDADEEIPDTPGDSEGAASVEARPDADEAATDAEEPVDAAEDPAMAPAASTPGAEPVVVKRGGFFPMLLGGIAAAVIGFGAARYVLPEGWPWPGARDADAIAQLTEANAAQEGRLDEIAGALDGLNMDDLQGQVAGLASRMDEISGTVSDLQARLETLETRPVAEPGSADTGAFAAELRALQDSVEARRSEIDALLSDAQAREAAAEATAQEALARAALSRVQTALDTGSDFSAALADLQAAGVSIPPALAEQAAGVPTMAQLSAGFPEAARGSLAAARKATGEDGGIGGFLRTQLGVRSLDPQEGDSPDAILSRAEAALRDGRLTDALAEIGSLPEQGRAELSDWVARAEMRQTAVAAAEQLTQSLTAN